MSTSAEQFTGTPLVAGEVFGVRAWDVDSLGRIKSPQFAHIWTPGENVAECQRARQAGMWMPSAMWTLSLPGGAVQQMRPSRIQYQSNSPTWAKAESWAATHYPDDELLGLEFETSSDAYHLQIGRTTKRGKTVQRTAVAVVAEVLDRVAPPQAPPKPDHDFTTCSCGFYAYLNGTNDYAEHHVIGVVQGYGDTFLGTRGFRSAKAKIVAAYASTYADVERVRPLPVSRDRMRELYPDVAWFDDYAAMVAEFPPSDPEPTPTTDPDFWTRSA